MKEQSKTDSVEDMSLSYLSDETHEDVWVPETKVEVPLLDFGHSISTFSSDENIEEDLEIAQEAEADDIQDWMKSIEKHFGKPAAGGIEHHGLQPAIHIQHSYPLHYAAAEGDLELLTMLTDLDHRDSLDSTPLHVAVYKNHLPVVQFLVEKGADINAMAYGEFSPLALAVKQEYTDIIQYLLNQESVVIDQNALLYAMTHLADIIETLNNDISGAGNMDPLIDCLATIEKMSQGMEVALIKDPESDEYLPISIILEILSQETKHMDASLLLVQSADKIKIFDHSYDTFIQNKLLTHLFAIDGHYDIRYSNDEQKEVIATLDAEGLIGPYAIDYAKNSIQEYLRSDPQALNDRGREGFEKVQTTIEKSYHLFQHAHDVEVISEYIERYQKGEMLFIPSGWDGHFVVIIADGQNHYLVSANTGEAFDKMPSGSIFYQMKHPENFTNDVLSKILSNEEQFDLEFDLYYKLGLTPVYQLESPPQVVGNCGWRSVEVSVKALLFLEYINQGLEPGQAKDLADLHYQDWFGFSKMTFLEDYLAHDLTADVNMLAALLQSGHDSLYDDQLPLNLYELQTAQLLLETLASPEFKDAFEGLDIDFSQAIQPLRGLLAEYNVGMPPHVPDIDLPPQVKEVSKPASLYTWGHGDEHSAIEMTEVFRDVAQPTQQSEPFHGDLYRESSLMLMDGYLALDGI